MQRPTSAKSILEAIEAKPALAGGAAGFCMAGPLGAVIGSAIGTSAQTSSEDCSMPKRYAPQIGGAAAACAALFIAGPVTAIAAGAAAAGGSYFSRMPREDKIAAGVQAATTARDVAVQLYTSAASYAVQQWAQLNMRRLQDSHDAGQPSAAECRQADARKATAALSEDGFALHPVREVDQPDEWRALEHFLRTDARNLGVGRDISGGRHSYNALRLACAWRIEHPAHRSKYEAACKESVLAQMRLLERKGALASGAHRSALPVATAQIDCAGLPLDKLIDDANEAYLLHGTNERVLLSILSTSLNPNLSGSHAGTAFGDGVYLAEDVGKTDQYCDTDARYQPASELHRRLYGRHHPHTGNLCYVLVCRVALGCPAVTTQMGRRAVHRDTGAALFPVSFRELTAIPGVSPPVMYHSLIAGLGGSLARYREFILFHGEYVCPQYLLAYQRCYNGRVVSS